MLKEIRSDILWCYRDDRKRFYSELLGGLAIMAGALGLTLLVIGVWG